MVKRKSYLASNEMVQVQLLVELLIERLNEREGLPDQSASMPIGARRREPVGGHRPIGWSGRAISLASSTLAPSAELLATRVVSQHGVRGVRGRHVCL